MGTRTELQRILHHHEDNEAGWYERPEMLVRLAQLNILSHRDISQVQLAKELKISKETVGKYFNGYTPAFDAELERTSPESIDYAHDTVEQAIERIVEKKGRVQATVDPEEALVFQTALTATYMEADHKRWGR